MKKYGYNHKNKENISAYQIMYKSGSLILRVQLKSSNEWLNVDSSLSCKKLPPLTISDLQSEDEFWKAKKSRSEARGRTSDIPRSKRPRSEDSRKTGDSASAGLQPAPKLANIQVHSVVGLGSGLANQSDISNDIDETI